MSEVGKVVGAGARARYAPRSRWPAERVFSGGAIAQEIHLDAHHMSSIGRNRAVLCL
jgi:hypothetical protein